MLRTGKNLAFVSYFVLLLCFAPPSAEAQGNGYIKGKVADSAGGEIANVKVFLASETAKFEATTDKEGLFEFKLPAGIYQLSTEKIPGFVPITMNKLRVKPDKSTMLHIRLSVNLKDAECILRIEGKPIKDNKVEKKPKR